MTERNEMAADLAPDVLDPMVDVAHLAAEAARVIVRKMFRTRLEAQTKDDESPVTEADRQVEQALAAVIAAHFPDHGILGEEFGVRNPGSEWCWVLDPIDGTRAFITGRPLFGTLIGLLHRGRPVLGLMDQPLLDERWVGRIGYPTVFTGPMGGIAGTRDCPSLALAELSCTAPDMIGPADRAGWETLEARVRRVSWGGDCYAYGLLALGYIDLIAEAGLKIWDWAALHPIIEGAGGRLTDWRGQPLTAHSDGHVLAVGDPARQADAIAALAVVTAPEAKHP